MKKYLFTLIAFTSLIAHSQTGVTSSGSFIVNGVSRTYTIYVPAIYNGSAAVPLVMNLHGLSGTSEKQENYQDFRKIADTANFIVVHPEGEEQSPFPTAYSAPGWGVLLSGFAGVTAGAPDREFILRLIDTVKVKYTINANKVYSTGFSQGGFLSQHLACLYDNRFAAIASVSGGLANEYVDSAKRVHAIPVMEIHGTADGTISYNGGTGYKGVDSLIKYWVCFNNCNTTPIIDTLDNIDPADNSYPIHYVYDGGVDGATVELYKIVDGGHQVPSEEVTPDEYGLGARNRDFTASEAIWNFFNKYSLDMFTSIPSTSPCIFPITGINAFENKDDSFFVYPNPSNGIFKIELGANNKVSIRITNTLGETIFLGMSSEKNTTINISDAPSGIYFYELGNQNGYLAGGKLILN